MSILNKISKLVKLSEKIDFFSQKGTLLVEEDVARLEKDYQRILKSVHHHEFKKTGLGLSSHVHHVSLNDELNIKTHQKTDITFQFPNELNAVFEDNDAMLVTPPQSPVKMGMVARSLPPSPTKLKSPSKSPTKPMLLQSFGLELEKNRQTLEETNLFEARSVEYLERVVKLGEKVKSLLTELQDKVTANKAKMISSFKTLMGQNNLPYVEDHANQLLGELFDIVHRDEGTFEQLAKNLSKGFAKKLIEQKYPDVLDELKQQITILLKNPKKETKENIEKLFKQVLKDLELPDSQDFYVLFQNECSEFLNDDDLDFHAKKFVKNFSARLMAINILEVRNKVVQQNPALFNPLGKVDVRPENYFELTKESKQLGQHFIQTLYGSPERIEVLLHFQKIKENTIKTDLVNSILSFRNEMYNQELIYVENLGDRTYIQSASDCQDLNALKLVTWDELAQNIRSIFSKRQSHLAENFNETKEQQVEKLLSYVKASYDRLAKTFASIPAASEQNTCISFFPIQFESLPSGKLEHVCLVTTSGAVNKLDSKNQENIKALLMFQEMVKSFAEQSKPLIIDGKPYTFIYHDEEKGAIDVLLQQINKGLSGRTAPLSSFASENELVLNDPFRGCAEKKFIDFVRCQLTNPFDSKKMTILGAANLRMPIVPLQEHAVALNESLVRLYKTVLDFYKTDAEGPVKFDLKKTDELKTKLLLVSEKDHAHLVHCSSNLGKFYGVAKNKLNLFVEKITAKLGTQKLYDHCLENYQDLTMPVMQKNEIKIKEKFHYGSMVALYSECLKFLNARKLILEDEQSPEDFLQKDIAKLNQFVQKWNIFAQENIEALRKISTTTKTADLFKKQLDSAVKAIQQGLKLIDQPNKPFFTTQKMIETYTKFLKEAQQAEQDQLICASIVPVSVNYNSTESTTLETNYIDCCCACTANKLPVLTWLTDLQKAKQEKLADFECGSRLDFGFCSMPVKKVLFSFASPTPSVAVSSNSTTLSPLVRSLNLNDTGVQQVLGIPLGENLSESKEGTDTKVARKLFG